MLHSIHDDAKDAFETEKLLAKSDERVPFTACRYENISVVSSRGPNCDCLLISAQVLFRPC